jgi:hypothetical protein
MYEALSGSTMGPMNETLTNGAMDHAAGVGCPVAIESHDVGLRGATVRIDLTGRAATLNVGAAGQTTAIEITPTGPLPGDYFVGTFNGPRIVALVRLSDDYDRVEQIDLIHMVEAEKDVGDFPAIGVVEADGAKQLQVVGGGAPARLEVHPLPEG